MGEQEPPKEEGTERKRRRSEGEERGSERRDRDGAAALELRGAAAIFAGYVRDTTISHNSVAETGYTAISLGWASVRPTRPSNLPGSAPFQ